MSLFFGVILRLYTVYIYIYVYMYVYIYYIILYIFIILYIYIYILYITYYYIVYINITYSDMYKCTAMLCAEMSYYFMWYDAMATACSILSSYSSYLVVHPRYIGTWLVFPWLWDDISRVSRGNVQLFHWGELNHLSPLTIPWFLGGATE